MFCESGMNIFDLAKRQRNGTSSPAMARRTRHVLVCGAPNAGKSTWIARFFDTCAAEARRTGTLFSASPLDISTLPHTVALDCVYARRSGDADADYELAYIWELGGGGSLADLIDLVLTSDTARHFSVFLFLDLCRPSDFQPVVEPLLDALRRRTDLGSNGSDSARSSRTRHVEHKDAAIIRPLDVPLTIVAAKYDLFQNVKSERKRTIWRFLRYLTHINGANLVTLSNRVDALSTRTLALLTSGAFGGSAALKPNTAAVDVHGAVQVAALADSVDAIELPLRVARVTSNDDAMRQWASALADHFTQAEPGQVGGALSSARRANGTDPSRDAQYAEPMIDRLVDEKMRDFQQLAVFIRRRADRRRPLRD